MARDCPVRTPASAEGRTRAVTVSMRTKAKIPVTAAERKRRFRTRRRNGLCSVRVLLHLTEIDALVDRGFLKPERRDDQDDVESAINSFICNASKLRKSSPVSNSI